MKVADGFEVKLFAGEPQLVNPIAMTVDEKGRVWVVECFEYPKRTEKGKMPRDRIVILEDTDGDGVCDKRTVFAEGKDFPVPFDMASGLEVGNGGVYVGAPPYLFFIENKNDKPGKFEVLLKGFGSQDTHETLNTFQWGPDGWLYGLHGVFTHSEVKPESADGPGTRLNAAVWRFHPKTKKFEIFSEGTSNPWGMDWRNTDGQFILCCCVIPHLFHMVPGGIYKRQGGQSFNQHAYGEIKEICDHTFHKESGWAHAGLISLDTPIMPEKYRNSVIFGSIHGCSLKQNILKPNGSTYTAMRGDDFLVSGDKNFRPINLRWGPNGEIYCIDWHDQNPCHQAAHDAWDYERGRVYRIQPVGLKTKKPEDFNRKYPGELAGLLRHGNPYVSRTAARVLSEKKGLSQDVQREMGKGEKGFMHLWRCGVIDDETLTAVVRENLLASPSFMHLSLVRAIAQDLPRFDKYGPFLKLLAESASSPALRRELASAAVRWSPNEAATVLTRALLTHKEDDNDPIIPQLLWVAYEKQIAKSPSTELDWLRDNTNELVTNYIIPRAMRRLVATGKAEDLTACVKFLGNLKDSSAKLRALEGLVTAMQNRQFDAPAEWTTVSGALAKQDSVEIKALVNKLAINFRDVEAVKRALAVAVDAGKTVSERVGAIRDLALAYPEAALEPLQKLATSEPVAELRIEAIRALASYNSPAIAKGLLAGWATHPANIKNEIINVLAGRKVWARELLNAVGTKQVARTDLTDNTITRIQALKDKELEAQVDKVWGRIRATPAELNELINKTRDQLGEARASFARGKLAFDNHCAKCHKFEGRGFEVGPNIEGAGRDIEYLLVNVLDPNRVIGSPYFMRTITKLNGTTEQGLLHAEDEQTITIKAENAVLKVIAKKDIEEIRIQEKSLMPEGFGSNIKIQEFRDLIRYTMAHPFMTDVAVFEAPKLSPDLVGKSYPFVGVTGRIEVSLESHVQIRATVTATETIKTKLLLGIRPDAVVKINGKEHAVKGSRTEPRPDQVAIDVELSEGENIIVVAFRTFNIGDEGIKFQAPNKEAVYLRFHDPDRKLRYPEPDDEKK
ncbi:MAG: c-type cytochrome [Planctomycetes bacterium]|nr:c-type cytochrome [Planctomycetota bacterium]